MDDKSLLDQIKDETSFMDRRYDKGIVNEKTGAVVGLKQTGEAVLASSPYGQYRVDASGTAEEVSIISKTRTVTKDIKADEIIVNKHKLNPQLWELTDMKQLFGDATKAVGNLTMVGTVLVKAWEPTLKKYVLIRRQARIPIFSPMLNVVDAPEQYGVDTDIAGDLLKYRREE